MIKYFKIQWHLRWCIFLQWCFSRWNFTLWQWQRSFSAWLYTQSVYRSAELYKLDQHATLKAWIDSFYATH